MALRKTSCMERASSDHNVLLKRQQRPLVKQTSLVGAATGSCPCSPSVKKSYRLVTLGSAKTGKTSIVNRFLDNTYNDHYKPTVEEFYRKQYHIKGDIYQLDILDTSGNCPYPAARRLSLLTGDLFLLVFGFDNEASLEEVFSVLDQIIDAKAYTKGQKIPVLIAANKDDLDDSAKILMEEEAQQRVSKMTNKLGFVVCSAKTGKGIDTIFKELFELAKMPKEMSPQLHRKLTANSSLDGTGKEKTKFPLTRMKSRIMNPDTVTNSGKSLLTAIDFEVRRPSLRTELLKAKKQSNFGSSLSKKLNSSLNQPSFVAESIAAIASSTAGFSDPSADPENADINHQHLVSPITKLSQAISTSTGSVSAKSSRQSSPKLRFRFRTRSASAKETDLENATNVDQQNTMAEQQFTVDRSRIKKLNKLQQCASEDSPITSTPRTLIDLNKNLSSDTLHFEGERNGPTFSGDKTGVFQKIRKKLFQ